MSDVHGGSAEAAKRLKEKAGREAELKPLRLFSKEGRERLYRAQLRHYAEQYEKELA